MAPFGIKLRTHYILAFVKLLARLVRPVYSVEKRSSKEQLRDDFGDFPPAPLRCENLSGDFYLVRTRGIGEIYHMLVMVKRMMRGMGSDAQALSPEVMNLVGGAQGVLVLVKLNRTRR